MENFDNEIFGFKDETNEELEQTTDFNYDSISGLGESNYENEDLFTTEVENDFANDFRIGDFEKEEIVTNVEEFKVKDSMPFPQLGEEIFEYKKEENEENYMVDPEQEFVLEPSEDATSIVEENNVSNENVEEDKSEDVVMSETPIEELNKLTEYKEEKIEKTDINELFNRVTVNVQDASEIFRKNTDLKQKIDNRFEELKKLQSEIENSRKKQIDEINAYKEEVVEKLTEKKAEIEKRLNILKESQATLEKEKQEFEAYKKKEQENIEKVQKEVQTAYDDRREELSHIEDVLRKQKDALDEERSQLSLDRIQYESDKNELANNLLKFNDLVNSFTNGVDEIKE